jgi:Rps23 Pro-64 3,4-dihydroxylase Tpa1-like proline 4-hydroxylase
MGKLRQNPVSGKGATRKDGKRPNEQVNRRAEPLAKRRKLQKDEIDDSALAPASKQGFEALVHPMKVKDFVKRYWEMSQPVHFERGYDPAWNAKLVPSLSSKTRITSTLSSDSNTAYYLTDVQLMGYSIDEDDLFFSTPQGGPVNMDNIWKSLEDENQGDKPSLQVSNLDIFSHEVHELLSKVDAFWRGDGAASSMLTAAAPGSRPFGVHADGQAQFILQIRGSQTVTIYEQPGAPESFIEAAGEEFAFPCLTHGPLPEMVLDRANVEQEASKTTKITLKAGSTLFLPSCVKLSEIPAKASEHSISLVIYLSQQPRWGATLDTLISLASSTTADIHSEDSFSPSDLDSLAVISSETGESTEQDVKTMDMDDLSEDKQDNEALDEELLDGSESGEIADLWTLFPHNFDENDTPSAAGMRLKTLVVEVLHRAANLAPSFIDSLMETACYPRHLFIDAIPEIRKSIGEAGIEAKLEENDGFFKISNFFSPETAEHIHQLISRVAEEDWQDAYAEEDAKVNNIDHAFQSARTFPSHHALFALFKRIMPELMGDFSMGKYTESHFIAPHDDRAYKEVNGEHFSRHIAVIYYSSKNWKAEFGGQLVDMVTGKEYVPEFNSLVAFRVPRFHQVKPVLVPSLERYSIFGWFFKPGINYELWQGEMPEEEEEDDS